MTACEQSSGSWTGRRWAAALITVLVAHVALLFWVARDPASPGARAVRQAHVRFTSLRELPRKGTPSVDQLDPTLFALANEHGFSSSAWLELRRFEYQVPNSSQPLAWLAPPVDHLGDALADFVQTNLLSEDVVLDQLPPPLAHPDVAVAVVSPMTAVKAEGPLTERALLNGPRLPQYDEGILTNTVVRVVIDQEGNTVSAALLSSCGVAKADQDALAYAKAARFEPRSRTGDAHLASETDLTVGRLVFQWVQVRWSRASPIAARR